MGSVVQLSNPEYDASAERRQQQHIENQRIAEEQRVAQQGKMSAMVADSLNALPLPKDEKGNPDINNPAYNDILQRRQKLIGSLTDMYTPVQHANLIQRVGGMLTGNKQHAMPRHDQPLPAMGTGPAALAAQAGGEQAAQAQQDLQNQIPQQPMETVQPLSSPFSAAPANHPLHAITSGIKALGEGLKNHAQAFAHPNIPKPDQSGLINNIATSYQDPQQLAHERAMELWGKRIEGNENVANIRAQNMRGIPYNQGAMDIDHAIDRAKVTGEEFINSATGQPFDLNTIKEALPGSKLIPIVQGKKTTGYLLADEKQRLLNWDNQQHIIGEFNIDPTGQIAGLKNVPTTTQRGSVTKDQYGNVSTSDATTTRTPLIPAPVSSAAPQIAPLSQAPPAPPAGEAPNPPLLIRPPVTPTQYVAPQVGNPGARAPGTQPTGGAVKAGPVSANAPAMPKNLPPLDADGNIPAGVGNPQVRQFANDLLNDRDVDKIPPKARAAAEAMARPYGWEQGKFTPMQLTQIQESKGMIEDLVKDKTFNDIYNSNFVKRGLISSRIHGQGPSTAGQGMQQAFTNLALNDNEQNFIKTYQNLVGRINGLAQLTRGQGRSADVAVKRMIAELPDPILISSPAEAKKAFALIQNEIDVAMKKRQWSEATSSPVSKNAPSAAPPKVGDIKTFPNGNKGKWDGTGWEAQ